LAQNSIFSADHFPSLQNSDKFYEHIINHEGAGKRILSQILLLSFFSFIYGITMGIYQGIPQAIAAGAKVALLFIAVLLICFPAFFIVQFILGSRLKIYQMVSMILSGFVLTTAIMAAFTPIIVIFLLTGGNYYFLQLLHIGIFAFAGIFGMNTVVQALKYSCEKKSVYPRTGVVVHTCLCRNSTGLESQTVSG